MIFDHPDGRRGGRTDLERRVKAVDCTYTGLVPRQPVSSNPSNERVPRTKNPACHRQTGQQREPYGQEDRSQAKNGDRTTIAATRF